MSVAQLRQEHIAFQSNLYDSANPTRRWLHNTRRDWVMRALERIAPPQPVYLEIGIGCGIYTRAMAKQGPVFALDINPAFVDAANQLPNVVAQVSDITKTALAPVHDVALCSEVLEHLPPDLSLNALRNMYASIKPGGHLVLTTPNSWSSMEAFARLLSFKPAVQLARAIYGESVDDLGHTNRLTRQALMAQIQAAGFSIVEQNDLALYLPVIAEFGGARGLAFAKSLEHRLRAMPVMSQLLWTQCYILRRPDGQGVVNA